MTYKVGFKLKEVYIYDSDLINAEEALIGGRYVAMISSKPTNGIFWGKVWSHDAHEILKSNKGTSSDISGDTIEIVFLKVKLTLIEYVLDSSIMDLELPDELL